MNLQEMTAQLTAAGVQPTAQRLAVYRYLLTEADHPTVEEIKAAVDQTFPKISLATVYNTVNALVRAGLLKAIKLPHSGKIVYDHNTSDHFHFIDRESGVVTDVDQQQVEVTPHLPDDYEVTGMEVFIHGTRK